MNLKATIVVQPYDKNDKIFDYNNLSNAKYFYIREELKKNKILVHTQDILPEEKSDFSIYIDHHVVRPRNKKNYLIVNEPHPVVPKNHDINALKLFNKVFTWNDALIDNKKIFKIQLSYDFSRLEIINQKNQSGFCLVNSNKKSDHKYENYSLRYDVIDFFKDRNDKFDLYGKGWDKMAFKNFYTHYIFKNFNQSPPNSWKGPITHRLDKFNSEYKRKIVSNYKFQFAIENTKNVYGYITEKIIDCFLSGNIPLYSGCKNINDFIPSKAYINLDDFKDFKEAYKYIINMTTLEEELIKQSGKDFLEGSNKEQFDSKHTSKIVVNNIINDFS
jgi:hypothetical protein